jgi:hypothetical protein
MHATSLVMSTKSPECYSECSCGWRTETFHRRDTQRAMDAEQEHMREVLNAVNPVVKAKLDELIETGNKHGVTPELVQDVQTVIGSGF